MILAGTRGVPLAGGIMPDLMELELVELELVELELMEIAAALTADT